MPELPEVEVTRRRIGKLLVGREIARLVTTKPSYFFLTSPRKLQQELVGCMIVKLERHGKYILARLDSGACAAAEADNSRKVINLMEFLTLLCCLALV